MLLEVIAHKLITGSNGFVFERAASRLRVKPVIRVYNDSELYFYLQRNVDMHLPKVLLHLQQHLRQELQRMHST